MTGIPINTAHFFSQLVYLDTAPAMEENGAVRVNALCGYYLNNPIGRLYMKNRFGDIPEEYGLWLDMLEKDAEPYRDWLITDVFDDNRPRQSGFYGCSYVSPENERVIAFRGSELLGNRYYENDYITDLGLAYMLKTPQQLRVDDYWGRFGRSIAGDFVLTGHSLGGNLAAYGAITAPHGIRECVSVCAAFNAPGFNREFIGKNKGSIAEASGRIRLLQNKYDPVSSMLENVTGPEIIESKFIPSQKEKPSARDIFYPHSNFMYETSADGGFVCSGDKAKCLFCDMVHTLSDMLLALPAHTREKLSKVLLAALYTAPSPEKAGRYMLDAAIKYIFHSGDFPIEGKYGELAYSAELLERLGDVPELYTAALTPPAQSPGKTDAGGARTLVILLNMLAEICLRKK